MSVPLSRRSFLRRAGMCLGAAALAPARLARAAAPKRLNVLLMTMDDLNCDSVGAWGCKTPDITPNIDRLAREGMRFGRAHVTIAVCQPCRSALMTGRYPHRSGGEGFHRITKDVPTLWEELARAGYATGILGKAGHSTPKASIKQDMYLDMGQLGRGRDPSLYHKHALQFMSQAAKDGRPFFLMANSHDPHRPFSGSDQEKGAFGGAAVTPPSRTYSPGEVEVPGFLAELPEVRREIAEYYSSVRRCDDTTGAVLRALKESGQEAGTLVIFLSDHGMPLPFAKTNCYLHSTRTPLIVRWPGKVKPGSVEAEHFVSGIDMMPTVLEAVGLPRPEGMDGFGFLPLLSGGKQAGRERVFTQFHQTSGRGRFPMRCVQDARFGYLFSPWSDGQRVFRNESQSGRTMKAMAAAAKDDPKVAARVKLFLYRKVEELYDLKADPDCLHDLIGDPKCSKEADRLRGELEAWMRRTEDPALEALLHRDDPEALAKFMAAQNAAARAVGGGAGAGRKNNKKKADSRR